VIFPGCGVWTWRPWFSCSMFPSPHPLFRSTSYGCYFVPHGYCFSGHHTINSLDVRSLTVPWALFCLFSFPPHCGFRCVSLFSYFFLHTLLVPTISCPPTATPLFGGFCPFVWFDHFHLVFHTFFSNDLLSSFPLLDGPGLPKQNSTKLMPLDPCTTPGRRFCLHVQTFLFSPPLCSSTCPFSDFIWLFYIVSLPNTSPLIFAPPITPFVSRLARPPTFFDYSFALEDFLAFLVDRARWGVVSGFFSFFMCFFWLYGPVFGQRACVLVNPFFNRTFFVNFFPHDAHFPRPLFPLSFLAVSTPFHCSPMHSPFFFLRKHAPFLYWIDFHWCGKICPTIFFHRISHYTWSRNILSSFSLRVHYFCHLDLGVLGPFRTRAHYWPYF